MFPDFDELKRERDVTDQALLEWASNVSPRWKSILQSLPMSLAARANERTACCGSPPLFESLPAAET